MNQLNMTSIAAGAGILTLYKSFTSLVSAVKGFSQQALQSYSNFEQIESGLQGVLKDVKKGTDMFEDLRKFSFDTTFGVDTLANAAQQLIGVGESASTLKTTLLQLGNVASGDTNKFNELVSIFAKIQNTGKAGSMQLQQLALRGVPIYQYLKQIGVQGTATGEDIRKAFEMMTGAGGEFEGAMERINNTIQGKEGFISDTWREFLTSFADASGIADMYKSALDAIYGDDSSGLQGIVNWLQKINENPVHKAILQGTLATAIVSLSAGIGVTLFAALVKINAQLGIMATLKAIINPTAIAAGLLAGAIVGGTVALSGLINKGKEGIDVLKEQNQLLIDQKRLRDAVNGKTSNELDAGLMKSQTESMRETLEGLKKRWETNKKNGMWDETNPDTYFQKISAWQDKITIAQKEIARLQSMGVEVSAPAFEEYMDANGKIVKKLVQRSDAEIALEKALRERNDSQKRLNELMKDYEKNLGMKALEENIASYEQAVKVQNEYERSLEKIGASNPFVKQENDIKDISEKLVELDNLYKTMAISGTKTDKKTGKTSFTYDIAMKINPSYQRDIDEAKKWLEKQRFEAKIKLAVDKQGDYQKFLQDTFGFSGEDVLKGATTGKKGVTNEQTAYNYFMQKRSKQNDKLNTFREAGLIRTDNLTVAQEYLDTVNQIVSAFEKSDNKNINDDTIKLLQDLQANAIADVFNAQIEAYDKELENFNKSAEEIRRDELKKQGYKPEQIDDLISKKNEISKRSDLMGWLKEKMGNSVQSDALSGNNQLEKAKTDFIKMFNDVKNLDLKSSFSDIADAFANVGGVVIDTLQGIAVGFASSVVQASGDLQAFAEGFQTGGIIGGIIAVVVEALYNVCEGIDGFEEALNPVTTLFQNLSELIRFLMTIISVVVHIIESIAKVLNTILKVLKPILILIEKVVNGIGNFIEWIADGFESIVSKIFWWVEVGDEKASQEEEEIQRLQRLKDEYSALYDAMKEQEEYYLNKKNQINADFYNDSVTKVNDMILTDKGVFSTDPKDTILAMKRPSDLVGSGGARVYVTINNYSDSEVTTEETTNADGSQNLIVNISRAVAADYASGANGWDSAYEAQQSRMSGRRVSI